MTDQMTPAERLREAARTLRDDIREPYDAPLADWLDSAANRYEANAEYGTNGALNYVHPDACRVADAVLGGEQP